MHLPLAESRSKARGRSVHAALLGTLLLVGRADGEPFTVTPDQAPASLVDHVELLEDPDARLRFEDVSSPAMSGRFVANPPGHELNFGSTSSAYWFRFSLANPAAEAVALLVEVAYPPLDRIELYQPRRGGGVRSDTVGDTFPYYRRLLDLRHFVFPVEIPAATTNTYYLRVETVGALFVPLGVSAVGPYLERTHDEQLLLGFFYGILLGAALYNLFLLSTVREAVYFYLVGHIASVGLGFAGLDGLVFRLWPAATGWQQWAIHVAAGSFSFFTVLFVRRFVSTADNSPRLDRLLATVLWALPVTIGLAALGGVRLFFLVNVVWVMAVGLVVGLTVLRYARRGHRPARIYAVAWGLLLLAIVASAAASLGLIPRFLDSLQLVRIVAAVEVTLAALAVAAHLDETRRALATSEAKFSRAFLSSPDAVVISTLDEGRVLEVNDGFEKMSGYSRDQAIGRTTVELGLWPSGEREQFVELLRRQGRVRELEATLRGKSGETWPALVSAEPIEVEGRSCLVSITRDIRQRQQQAEQQERLIRELEAKNDELERFTYTVSHDLKGPLVSINGFLGYLEEDAAAGDRQRVRHDAERIRSATAKMRQLLDELLELSRIGRFVNPAEDVALSEVAREAAELLAAPLARKGIDLDISPQLPVVSGDRIRLLEVFQNLLDNAVRHLDETPEPRIEIGKREDGDVTVCFVRDNGAGIDPRHHEKIFELFTSLDPKSEGTGIGLALVERIIEFHGGRIWVESAGEGRGATFCFILAAQSPSGPER